jgi:exodeoxyribonuclease VII large subunit
VRVNGREAAPFVAEALRDLDARGGVDVILVVRGGGSREDLTAFDAEGVVRAIAAARTPVVTGIGHETDVTLADLAADRRAPTPTGAAELVVPVRAELLRELERRGRRLEAAAAGRVRQARRRLELAGRAHGLFAPGLLVQRWRERLDAAERRLARVEPGARIRADQARLDEAEARLLRAARAALARAGEALGAGALRLESLSPLRVLARGYSLTTDGAGAVVRDAAALAPGQVVRTRLERGAFQARVEAVEPAPVGLPTSGTGGAQGDLA